jgi:hypothetical protein
LTASSKIDPRANFGLRRRRDLEMQSAHDPAFCRHRLILVNEP